VPAGLSAGKRAVLSITDTSPPPIAGLGSRLTAGWRRGRVWEFKLVVSALTEAADFSKRRVKIERTPAWAKSGIISTAKDARPIESLKNNAFFAFFAEYGSTTEEVSILWGSISLN
jgi:hypothetical protein